MQDAAAGKLFIHRYLHGDSLRSCSSTHRLNHPLQVLQPPEAGSSSSGSAVFRPCQAHLGSNFLQLQDSKHLGKSAPLPKIYFRLPTLEDSNSETRVVVLRKHHARWRFPQEEPPRTLFARELLLWFRSDKLRKCRAGRMCTPSPQCGRRRGAGPRLSAWQRLSAARQTGTTAARRD